MKSGSVFLPISCQFSRVDPSSSQGLAWWCKWRHNRSLDNNRRSSTADFVVRNMPRCGKCVTGRVVGRPVGGSAGSLYWTNVVVMRRIFGDLCLFFLGHQKPWNSTNNFLGVHMAGVTNWVSNHLDLSLFSIRWGRAKKQQLRSKDFGCVTSFSWQHREISKRCRTAWVKKLGSAGCRVVSGVGNERKQNAPGDEQKSILQTYPNCVYIYI